VRKSVVSAFQEPHDPLPAIHEDAVACLEALRGIATADDGGQAELAGDDGGVVADAKRWRAGDGG
jgi:hypothetical protein